MRFILLIATLLFVSIGAAQAQPDRHTDSMKNVKERILRVADKLEFSEEQRAETRELLQSSFADLKVIREEMEANREEMKALAEDPDYNDESVAELSTAQGELFAQQIEIRMATRAAFNDILTEDQKDRLEEFKAARIDRREFLRDQRRDRREHFNKGP